jgi:DNA ligase (NAD+)
MTLQQKELLDKYIEASQIYYLMQVYDETEDNDDYEQPEPIMTDDEFDELKETLESFNDIEINQVINKSIITKKGVELATHTEMISLKKEKYLSKASLIPALKHLGYNLSNYGGNLYESPKLDGISLKVKYEVTPNTRPKPTLILTRGGQDVTHLMKDHKDLHITNEQLPENKTLHGELVLSKVIFLQKYSEEYANPRNAVVGVMKKDVNDLSFIPCTDGISPIQNMIKNHQFPWKMMMNIADLEEHYRYFKSDNFPYQIDGMVIGYKTDSQIIKDNYPMNLIAIKFPAPTAKTVCIGIEYTQKKSGNLTPVIIIEPTSLDGSTITKLAGYNYGNLKTNHIGIGSELLITKSGDIIPIVSKVLTRSNDIPMPVNIDYIIVGKHLKAMDSEKSETYKFILGLRLLEIDGIGETLADKIGSMVDYNIIKLFDPTMKPDIRNILGDGKVWEKFNIFYQTKTLTLDMVINILQFDRCGKTLSKKFAEIILGRSSDVKGIDHKVLQNVCKGDGFKKIQSSLAELKTYGVKVIKPIDVNEDTITYEMTGNPGNNLTKQTFKDKVKEKYPNSNHTTLTKDTKYLIVDSMGSTSSKMNKARKYNVTIITYDDFIKGNL